MDKLMPNKGEGRIDKLKGKTQDTELFCVMSGLWSCDDNDKHQ